MPWYTSGLAEVDSLPLPHGAQESNWPSDLGPAPAEPSGWPPEYLT